ncbi:DUF397 domain-containing protein [Streptomyces sp. NPDC050658]|uniref:DUF397 domain-containing protein n=1 Tax=unclassified Streptomyces TaxID=2593676 RepID=UPI003437E5A2
MPGLVWQKSSFSGDEANRDCIELATALDREAVLLRESDAPHAVLRTTRTSLQALLRAARSGSISDAASA